MRETPLRLPGPRGLSPRLGADAPCFSGNGRSPLAVLATAAGPGATARRPALRLRRASRPPPAVSAHACPFTLLSWSFARDLAPWTWGLFSGGVRGGGRPSGRRSGCAARGRAGSAFSFVPWVYAFRQTRDVRAVPRSKTVGPTRFPGLGSVRPGSRVPRLRPFLSVCLSVCFFPACHVGSILRARPVC